MCYVRQSGKPKEPRLVPAVLDGFTCASSYGQVGRFCFLPTPFLHPYLAHFGSVAIPTFGVLAAVGLMLALGLSERTARLAGLDPERLWDAGLFAVLAAFLSSRLLLIGFNFRTFKAYPLLLLTVPSLTAAGLLLTVAATLVWLWVKRVPVLAALDAWAPCATLVWFFLALGHFAEGSDPGMPFVYGIRPPGETIALHPVALYAAALALVLTIALYARLMRAPAPGETAGLALAAAGAGQFLLSFVRQPGLEQAGLDALQWVGVAMLAAGGVLIAQAKSSAQNRPREG